MPFKLVTLQIRRYAVILYMVIILVVISSISVLSARSFLAGKAWVDHTAEVISTVQSVQMTLLNAETGQRGFLLTQNTAYLIPYNDALLTIHRQIDNLKDLVKDNPVQLRRTEELDRLTNEFVQQLQKESVDELDTTRYTMDQIRILILKMINNERVLMNKRLLDVDDAALILLVCLSIVVVRDLIVVVWGFYAITHAER
jgi:CHASE3 domain sensor protein